MSLFAPPGSRDAGLELAFADAPWLDLVNQAFVSAADAEPNVKLRLVRLPDRWRSIDQPELSDDRGGKVVDGRLTAVVAGELGTPDSPWELDLGHAWQRTEILFQHYDVTARAVRPVVFGPLVEAFDDSRLRDRDLVAGSAVLDGDGRVHLMFFRTVDPAKLRIRFRTEADTVVATSETDPERRVQRVGQSALQAMTVADRQRHYPLPRLWLSRGQACRTEEATGATAALFEDAIAAALSTDVVPPRLHFDLDDFVLVNASGVPLGFARELDLTIFHHDMSIRAPKREPPPPTPPAPPPPSGYTVGHQPYFSDIAAGLNHFAGNAGFYSLGRGAEKTARVVRRGTTFYDLQGQRTLRGRIIGVRAAVANDHPHERIFLKHEPGTRPKLANCDLHYFEDVASDPTAPARSISVLLVFFSVRIRRLVEEVYQADLQDALGRAAERWSGAALADVLAGAALDVPDVRLRTDDGAHDVKFVFHFPAFDDREGHAVVWIRRDPRAFSASMVGLILIAQADSTAGDSMAGVEHGHMYPSETIAHELGHAMGLGDEYFERFPRHPIPTSHQYPWDFPHFSFDRHSMMHDEHEPRLRHYWVFSRWLERSNHVPRVRSGDYTIVSDTTTVSTPTAGRAHSFRLPESHAWPYEAVRQEPRFRPGTGGRGRLALYLLGDDYDAFRLPHTGVLSRVDAVLYWDLVVYIRRRANADGDSMTPERARDHAQAIYADLGQAVGTIPHPTTGRVGRCLVAELDTGLPASSLAQQHARRVLLYVLPRFTFSDPAAADFRVHLRLPAASPGDNVTDLHDPGFRRRRIGVHTGVPGRALLRYMMGKGAHAAHPGARIRITTTPLAVGASFSIGTSSASSTALTVVHAPRTSGANDHDGRGTPTDVARDLAEALNDPMNAYAAHVVAHASGNEVALEAKVPGEEVVLASTLPSASIEQAWGGDIAPAEVDFLADWLGEQLGSTYRMRAHD